MIRYTYDGWDVIREDSSLKGVTVYQNGLGIDDKLRSKNGTTVRYFITDHLGSTVALTDANGAITSSTTYDSFGNAAPKQAAGSAASGTGSAASSTGNAASNIATTYRYTGREYDADTGLYYYRNRWYDPELGRFISEDPIGFAGGDINLYGYVGNNPLSFIDPYGNYACKSKRGKELDNGNGSAEQKTKCWTYQDVLDKIKDDLNRAWERTQKTGRENGGFVVIKDNLELLIYKRPEGSKDAMNFTLPIARDLKKKYKYGVLAGFHTHPGDTANPSGIPGSASRGDFGVVNNSDGPLIGVIRGGNEVTVYDGKGIIKRRNYKKTFACIDPLHVP